jgi:rRNA-processing protein FCF1
MQKQILIDTNFLITCVKNKVDLFEQLSDLGFQIIIPEEVLDEIEKITKSKQSQTQKQYAQLTLNIIQKREFKSIKLNSKNVDSGIRNYCKEHPDVRIATLDKALRKTIKNPKAILRKSGMIEVI